MRCSVMIPHAPARRILQQCGYGDPRAPAPGGQAGPGRWTDGRGRMPSPPCRSVVENRAARCCSSGRIRRRRRRGCAGNVNAPDSAEPGAFFSETPPAFGRQG